MIDKFNCASNKKNPADWEDNSAVAGFTASLEGEPGAVADIREDTTHVEL